jgi:EmrB/QacA subfamily drug resistance transporter
MADAAVTADTRALLSFGEPRARWVLAATVLGSGLAFIDGTVVNVALPSIGESLDADVSGLQWIINAYTLTLASFILLGGSLGDRFGRRRVFVIGVVWFAVASLACGIAPNVQTLVAARAVQGVGGALLVPGSLAILQSSFRPQDRMRAIGAWSGLAGIAGAAGPFLGGYLIQTAGWRWVFLINLPLAVAVVLAATRHVPESRNPDASHSLDLLGAALGAVGLGSLTYALIAWRASGLGSPMVLATLFVGVAGLAAFVWREATARAPMLPLGIFRSRLFTATNLVTFAVYGALGGVFLFLVLTLQVVAGYSPLAAGSALIPMTVLLLLLSSRMGALATRIGPRLPMTVGPLLSSAAAMLLAVRVDSDTSYLLDVLPGVSLFGLGMCFTVAPLTATVLAAAPDRHAGIASGVNNAVARVAGLLAVAALPLLVGLDGAAYADPELMQPAYRSAMMICAGLLAAGGLLAAWLVRSPVPAAQQTGQPAEPAVHHHFHCPVDGPALEHCPQDGPLLTRPRSPTA